MDLGARQDGALLWNHPVAGVRVPEIGVGDLACRRTLDRRARDRLHAIPEDADRRHARMRAQLLTEATRIVQQWPMLLGHPRVVAEHVEPRAAIGYALVRRQDLVPRRERRQLLAPLRVLHPERQEMRPGQQARECLFFNDTATTE